MKPSTKDQVEGTLAEAAGSAKQKAGEISGNPKLEVEGLEQKLRGKVQKVAGKIEKVAGR